MGGICTRSGMMRISGRVMLGRESRTYVSPTSMPRNVSRRRNALYRCPIPIMQYILALYKSAFIYKLYFDFIGRSLLLFDQV